MHILSTLMGFLFIIAATAEQDLCPKNEYACLDVINSSQCLAQVVIQKLSPLTKENMIKCIEYAGVASSRPPAQKVPSIPNRSRAKEANYAIQFCRCPGCHTEPINAAIRELFPAPCS